MELTNLNSVSSNSVTYTITFTSNSDVTNTFTKDDVDEKMLEKLIGVLFGDLKVYNPATDKVVSKKESSIGYHIVTTKVNNTTVYYVEPGSVEAISGKTGKPYYKDTARTQNTKKAIKNITTEYAKDKNTLLVPLSFVNDKGNVINYSRVGFTKKADATNLINSLPTEELA